MIIETTAEQDREIQCWYQAIVRDHYADGSEPPGFTLKIELGHPSHFETVGEVVCGTSRLCLGTVEVTVA